MVHARKFRLMPSMLAVAALIAPTALADEAKTAKPTMPPGAASPKEKPEFPPFDEAMKDYKEVPAAEKPFLSLWYNKKSDSLRAQIPAAMIGQKFLIATSMSGGPIATGFQLDHFLAYLERMDKKLVLMRYDPRYVEGGDKPVADVIKRSYGSDIILKTFNIVTVKNGDLLVDLDDVFKNDFAGIGEWGLGSINPAVSKWADYKAFPHNVELTADLAMMRKGEGRRVLFHYSLSRIPESAKGYKPRVADDRVGYFMTVRMDWTKDHKARTLFDRYINRWQLEKRDPSLKLSAPKHPIVWYIEKTVPLEYRRWVKEGILEWNRAFEKCGFLDAIEVKQQEDYDPDTKDLDPEDVRYNFFRWIVTGRGFAMGPSRDHPQTGQIFDADIVFDDSMVRYYLMDFQRMTGGDEAWRPYDPFMDSFFAAHPEWRYRSPIQNLLPNVRLRDDPEDEFRRNLMNHMYRSGRPVCECAAGMAQQMQFAGVALEAQGLARDDDEFIGQIIKEVVMHEVGHCLGLRHNFKASTWLPMKEVEAHTQADDGNVGSVMDYNPAIVCPRGEEQGSYTTRSIGPYDYWAIEFGYRPVEKPHKSEEDMLKSIAGRVADAGLDYATDEDTFGVISPDPLTNRFDMGRDVVNYADRQIELVDGLLEGMADWAVKDGESYTRLRNSFSRVMMERARVANFVARFVGGQIRNRDHKGDPDARTPVQVVSAEKQREALEFVCENVFDEDSYDIDPKLLSHLAAGRHWHWDSDEFDLFVDFNIHDFVASNQYWVLFTMMNPFTIARVHDNQVQVPEGDDIFTLAEHINGITGAIWSELDEGDRKGTDRKPFIHSFRRNLQRNHVRLLTNLILSEPGTIVPADANAISRLALSRLSEKITSALKSADLDDSTEAHLADVKNRIDKALEAEFAIGVLSSEARRDIFSRETGEETEALLPILPDR